MHNEKRSITWSVALVTVLGLALLAQSSQAQTYNVIHSFSGGADGGAPYAGLTKDGAGNLYGTTNSGGYTGGNCASNGGCGIVFKLTRKNSAWVAMPLHTFRGNDQNDGAGPSARVIFEPDGSLYGTTAEGGGTSCSIPKGLSGCGTVFRLTPPPTACTNAVCPWTETVLYRFSGGSDGAYPLAEIVFDKAGNFYGTTEYGGVRYDTGVVFELTPSSGGWTESTVYRFGNQGSGGLNPVAEVTFDQSGHIYGTTAFGGYYGTGTVFELTYTGSFWVEKTLYSIEQTIPLAGVIFDQIGNLYGAMTEDQQTGGAVFELSPSGSGWVEQTLYSFPSDGAGGFGPAQSLIMDGAGNLYGTTVQDPDNGCGGWGCGTVFKLTPNPDGTWTNDFPHQFAGGSDGWYPFSNVIFDGGGNLYGTASRSDGTGCGGYGCGVVWEITP